jgi:hypothetical protein
MADPTQALRDKALSFIPGPLGESITKSKAEKDAQIIADEANNLVMQREATSLPSELQATLNPQNQPINRQPADLASQAVTRQPTEAPATAFPQAQGYGSAPEALIMSGLKQGQDAASQSIGATDALMSNFEKNEAARQQREATALSEVRKKIEDTDKEVANFKWDNKSVWEKSSTGQKVALAIGGFLSSLSPKSAEAFQNSIQTTLQNDLDQQKANYMSLKEKGKELQSYYGQLVQKFGSEQAADMAMMSAKMQMIQNRLKVTADTAQSKLVAANALKGFELTDAQMGKYKAEAAKLATAQQANAIPGYQGTITSDTAKNKFIESKDASDIALSSISELKTLGKKAKIPLTKESSSYDVLLEKLSNEIAKANAGGKPSDLDVENAKKMIPSVYSPNFETSLDSLAKRLQSDIKAKAKNLGLKPIAKPGTLK